MFQNLTEQRIKQINERLKITVKPCITPANSSQRNKCAEIYYVVDVYDIKKNVLVFQSKYIEYLDLRDFLMELYSIADCLLNDDNQTAEIEKAEAED